jgi:hypothetical protein
VIELFVLAGTLAVAAWATGAQARRRIAASRALERYSHSRALLFVPPPARPRGASPRVLGSKDDVGYVIELVRLGDEVRTRVSATARRGRAPVLSVLQRGAFLLAKEPVLVSGDETFDHAYVVAIGEAQDAEALREATRSLLLLDERCRAVWLSSDGHKVTLSWRGIASDPVIIDAACDAVVLLASWHRPESPYR